MPAYSKDIPSRKCFRCGIKATKEVFNPFNASCGFFCSKHAVQSVKRMNDELDLQRFSDNSLNGAKLE